MRNADGSHKDGRGKWKRPPKLTIVPLPAGQITPAEAEVRRFFGVPNEVDPIDFIAAHFGVDNQGGVRMIERLLRAPGAEELQAIKARVRLAAQAYGPEALVAFASEMSKAKPNKVKAEYFWRLLVATGALDEQVAVTPEESERRDQRASDLKRMSRADLSSAVLAKIRPAAAK